MPYVGQTMRYEYLNLAKWVETGSWLGPEPHPEAEVEFDNWTYFYQVYRRKHATKTYVTGWRNVVLVHLMSAKAVVYRTYERIEDSCNVMPLILVLLQHTNAIFRGREVCDCHRNKDAASTIENRWVLVNFPRCVDQHG